MYWKLREIYFNKQTDEQHTRIGDFCSVWIFNLHWNVIRQKKMWPNMNKFSCYSLTFSSAQTTVYYSLLWFFFRVCFLDFFALLLKIRFIINSNLTGWKFLITEWLFFFVCFRYYLYENVKCLKKNGDYNGTEHRTVYDWNECNRLLLFE